MKLTQVLFTLLALFGSATASNTTNTTRYEWNSTVSDQEAEQASVEVRGDFEKAFEDFNVFEQLSNLEKLQLYNEWKAEAWKLVKTNPNSRFKLHKSVRPLIMFFNTFAPRTACESETAAFVARLSRALNGILGSSPLDAEQEFSSSEDTVDSGGNVRGRRKLGCTCPACPFPGYYCSYVCGCRRRRLAGDDDELTLRDNTPEAMEALVNSVVGELQGQCEKRLKDIGSFSASLDLNCRDTLKAIRCEVFIHVWEAISLVVDGQEFLAADMIEAKLQESTATP